MEDEIYCFSSRNRCINHRIIYGIDNLFTKLNLIVTQGKKYGKLNENQSPW